MSHGSKVFSLCVAHWYLAIMNSFLKWAAFSVCEIGLDSLEKEERNDSLKSLVLGEDQLLLFAPTSIVTKWLGCHTAFVRWGCEFLFLTFRTCF